MCLLFNFTLATINFHILFFNNNNNNNNNDN